MIVSNKGVELKSPPRSALSLLCTEAPPGTSGMPSATLGYLRFRFLAPAILGCKNRMLKLKHFLGSFGNTQPAA